MRMRWLGVAAALLMLAAGPAAAQTDDTKPIPLQPTERCPQEGIDSLQRVIAFIRGQSWSETPGKVAFAVVPDTANCRVVLKIPTITDGEAAALQRGAENRLTIEHPKDRGEPSRLPLLLWIVFGGAGLVLVFFRYGRR